MAVADGNPSVQFLRLRVVRLGTTGAPVTGATGGFVSDQMIELADTPDIKTGQEIEVTTGAGELCVELKDPDVVKRRNLTLTICGVQDPLIELLIGALLLTDGGTTLGHADPELGEIPNPDGVSIEGWSKNLVGGAVSPTLPYFRWLYPRTYGWTRGPDALLNGHKAWVFNGIAIENSAMPTDGPASDWNTAFNATRVRAVYRTAMALPTASNDYVAIS